MNARSSVGALDVNRDLKINVDYICCLLGCIKKSYTIIVGRPAVL